MTGRKKPLEQYTHSDKQRVNNPPVGLVTPDTDQDAEKHEYVYDPHLDPQLIWAGKAEHTSFDVPTVSLHVHERIDPITIIEAVRKTEAAHEAQLSFFSKLEENPPLRDAIQFYQHPHGWSNRLIAGDSLLVMNSLLLKEGMASSLQMVYVDPPYGIGYKSNFQPFVNQRAVKEGRDEDLTSEPETIKAFRDTWELEIHSYLTYLRDRLLLARELLNSSGSIFVQISDENVHLVRDLLDEVFGPKNFIAEIRFQCRTTEFTRYLPTLYDYLLWYSKDKEQAKYHQLFYERPPEKTRKTFTYVELQDGTVRPLSKAEVEGRGSLPPEARLVKLAQFPDNPEDQEAVVKSGRAANLAGRQYFKRYADDFPLLKHTNHWDDTVWSTFDSGKTFVVQTHDKTISRCLLMTTDPGDLVLDITCGSGTTAYVAEHWGRRWITCDTSRVAVALARQRLMTSTYPYFKLARPQEGVGSGFVYETITHISTSSVTGNEAPAIETLYDRPRVDASKTRVSGPFTVEAVPSPSVVPLTELEDRLPSAEDSVARSGETLRQREWRDELLQTGIRGKSGQYVRFSRMESLPCRWLHYDAETMPEATDTGASSHPQRVVVSFGPEHAPIDKRQVERAIEEAQRLVPRPQLVVFAAFQFDPEAAKDIDETNWPGVTLLRAQMNGDLLTSDLKKKKSSNDSFWLIGQPDVKLELVQSDSRTKKYQVRLLGFDYYNTRTGIVESGNPANVAIWMLDSDYDGRSLFPRQVFLPMAGERSGWSKLANDLKGTIDDVLVKSYQGTVSLPFEPGKNGRVAVKVVDDRGIESLKIIEVV